MRNSIQNMKPSFLHLVAKTEIGPASCAVTIARSIDVFTGYLDLDFWRWGTDKVGVDTVSQTALVYKVVKRGNLAEIFGSLGGDACRFTWTQGQIVEFCRTHRHYLRRDGWGTWFFFKVEANLFFADVRVDGRALDVHVGRFRPDYICRTTSASWFVVPQ